MNMKKVIKLTESDLLRVVKKVISENNFEEHQRKVSDMLKRTKLDEDFCVVISFSLPLRKRG